MQIDLAKLAIKTKYTLHTQSERMSLAQTNYRYTKTAKKNIIYDSQSQTKGGPLH